MILYPALLRQLQLDIGGTHGCVYSVVKVRQIFGGHMILYPVLLRQDTKQDTKLKSVTLSDIRIPCNVNMKAGWEKP